MPSVVELRSLIRAGEDRLAKTLAGLTDETALHASLLPEWTVSHVIAHLAGNADSVTRRLEGVLTDDVVDQYPDGAAGRAEEIERRRQQNAGALVTDLRTSVDRMLAVIDRVLAHPVEGVWSRLSRGVSGGLTPADHLLLSRWQEIEIHHVDLGLGYTPADWPAEFVADRLPHALAGLPDRAAAPALYAWLIGRGPAPRLTDWD